MAKWWDEEEVFCIVLLGRILASLLHYVYNLLNLVFSQIDRAEDIDYGIIHL